MFTVHESSVRLRKTNPVTMPYDHTSDTPPINKRLDLWGSYNAICYDFPNFNTSLKGYWMQLQELRQIQITIEE